MSSSASRNPRTVVPLEKNIKKAEIKQKGRMRSKVVASVLALFMLITLGRVFYVQIVASDEVTAEVMKSRSRSSEVAPQRGSILDTNGRVLASSVVRYNLVVDQRLVKDYEVWSSLESKNVKKDVTKDIAKLADVLGVNKNDLEKKMIGDKGYAVIAMNLTPEVKDEALKLSVPGLSSEVVTERKYPNGNLAGNIIGFMSKDNKPLEGLELSQQEKIAGTAGEKKYEISADGVRIPTAPTLDTPAVDGNDVKLTIDSDLQWYAQKVADEKREESEAEWASILVLDAKTGKIRAMADSNTIDPANPFETENKFWRPMATTQPYEPGSTGKTITFAAAMENSDIVPTTAFTVANSEVFNGQKISDATRHKTHEVTASGVLSMSSNVGTVKIAESITDEIRYDYMKRFGIGDPIKIGLPYSEPGYLSSPENWDGRTRLTTSFGQGYSQTILHTGQIFQTFANDGVMAPPSLIESYIAPDGTEIPVPAPEKKTVLEKKTNDAIVKMLEGVTVEGINKAALLPGYRVGGKSGTAEVVGDTGRYDGYAVSFAGIYPLDNPRYVVVGAVYRPKSWMGNGVDAMVSKVGEYALRKDGIPTNDSEPDTISVYTNKPRDTQW